MRLRLVLAVLLAAALLPGPAEAARDGRVTLTATQHGRRVCVVLRRSFELGSKCGRAPVSPWRPVQVFNEAAAGRDPYAIAVAPAVRAVRLGRRTFRTVPARRAPVRLLVVARPPADGLVRFLGAGGGVLATGGLLGFETVGEEVRVQGTREDGVTASRQRTPEPAPGHPDRLRTLACVQVVHGNGGGGSCEGEVQLMPACDGTDLVAAALPAGAMGLRLVLGSGARLPLPVTPVGATLAAAGPVPAGEAGRAAELLGADGTVVARAELLAPPGGQPCRQSGPDDLSVGGAVQAPLRPVAATLAPAVAANAAGHRLLQADAPPAGPGAPDADARAPDARAPDARAPAAPAADGSTVAGAATRTGTSAAIDPDAVAAPALCAAFDALTPAACRPAPLDADRPRLLRAGDVVGVVLGGPAARVTFRFDRGRPRTVRTSAPGAYGGAWRRDVRVAVAHVPAGRTVTGATVRDARGRVVGRQDGGERGGRVTRRALLRERGLGVDLVRRGGGPPCVEAVGARGVPVCPPGGGQPIDSAPPNTTRASLAVPCGRGATVLHGRLRDGSATPVVELAGGETVTARVAALGGGEDAWLAVAPDAPVTGLRAGGRRVELRLPAPSAQCGYRASFAL